MQKFIKNNPFKIEKDSKRGKPKIIVEYLRKTISFFPEKICNDYLKINTISKKLYRKR